MAHSVVVHDRPQSPGNPTLAHHSSHFSTNFPTPALLGSVAPGAHYAGVKIDTRKIRHNSAGTPSNHLEIKGDHLKVIEDLQELYCCRPTTEIFSRRWRPDAQFEVSQCTKHYIVILIGNIRILCVEAKATKSMPLRSVAF